MKRTVLRLIVTVAALGLIANCGDSDTDDKEQKDLGINPQKDIITTQGDLDPNNPQKDIGSTVPKDQGNVTQKDGSTSQVPTKAVANSGAVCSQTVPCPDTVNEVCVPLKQDSAVGMCLGKCWPNLANLQDPINICPTTDPVNMSSSCGVSLQDPQTMQVMGYVCGWICEAVQGQNTLTFKCPNDTDYNCEVLNPQQPTIKACVPKEPQ